MPASSQYRLRHALGDLRRRGVPRAAPRATAPRSRRRGAHARRRSARRARARAPTSTSFAETSATPRPPGDSRAAQTSSSTPPRPSRSAAREARSRPSTSRARKPSSRRRSEPASRARSSSPRPRSTACRRRTRSIEDAPLEGVGHYGRSKIEAEEVARSLAAHGPEVVILRPKTFLGPERLGVFEILFDWIREGRRVPILGDGSNRYQLLDVDDLAEAVLLAGTKPVAGETLNIGATDFGTVRSDLEALIAARPLRQHAAPGARASRRARPPRARGRASVAARRVALQDRAPRLVRRRLPGAAPPRLAAAPLERGSARPEPTTGTSPTASAWPPPAPRIASPGTSGPSACSSA